MAANEKWLAERRACIKERNGRIAAQFAELRRGDKTHSNYTLYRFIARREGVSESTVRNAVVDAGLAKVKTTDKKGKDNGKRIAY